MKTSKFPSILQSAEDERRTNRNGTSKPYIVNISGVRTVILETVPEGQRQANWEVLRLATPEDEKTIPNHHYFTQGLVAA